MDTIRGKLAELREADPGYGAGPYWGLLSLADSVAAVTELYGRSMVGKDSPLNPRYRPV